jgi:hypothetical protein
MTSPVIKNTGLKGEKPKATINIQSVQGTILGGGTFKHLEVLCGMLDMPSMTHKTFDEIGYKTFKTAYDVAIVLCETNIKEEIRLTISNGGIPLSTGHIKIKGSYDGNWAKRSYRYTYNSLIGAGCLIGYFTGLPLWFGVKNKDCAICTNEKKRGKSKKYQKVDHECYRNWNVDKSAKAMEPAIAVEICQELYKRNALVATIIGDEDASTLKQIREQLISPLNEVEKESDINHIKRNLTNKINQLKIEKYKEKRFKLTAYNILHMVTNFGWALKTHQNKPIEAGVAINNVIPHSFGFHENCPNIGNGLWCHFGQLEYKPGFKNGKHLGENLEKEEKEIFQKDLQSIFTEMTTSEMLTKLAPCGSSQKNECLHSVVVSLASKSLHFGRSNSYHGRYSLAIIKMFKDNNVGQILLKKLNIEIGFNGQQSMETQNNRKRKQQEYKKRPEAKLERNRKKMKRSAKNSKAEENEEVQYKSGIGINETLNPIKQKISRQRVKDGEKTEKEFPFKCLVKDCTKKYKQKNSLKIHVNKNHNSV